MGKMKEKPKCLVFSFRTDDKKGQVILAAAKGYPTLSEFLEEAALWWAARLKEGKDA